jgi:hypothetical protein
MCRYAVRHMREGDRIVRLTSRALGNPQSLSVVAMPWRDPRVSARTSAGLLAFLFVRAASIAASGYGASVTENAVVKRVALFPDQAVYRDAGASYGCLVLHARAIDAADTAFFYDNIVREGLSRCHPERRDGAYGGN